MRRRRMSSTAVRSRAAVTSAPYCARAYISKFRNFIKMNNFERILAEQVRRHKHLYDPNMRDHSDLQLTQKAWSDVAASTGKDEAECRKVWKNLRDKFVRIKKRVHARSSDPSPYKLMAELGWLSQYVKHRGKDPNMKVRNN